MKLSLRWLRDWIDPGNDPGRLAARMTEIGLAVDAIERPGEGLREVVVARVESVERHPNADRLSLCTVFDGRSTVRVVCGAPNVEAGRIYPLARVGATLPGGLVIRAATIRGERSEGMLCSAKELGLSEDGSGLFVLDEGAALGASLDEALDLADAVFEIDVPYNRPDWLSVRGIARELSAALGQPLVEPRVEGKETGSSASNAVRVSVIDQEGCPFYGARIVRNLRIGPSPAWLRRRLEAIGQRSINNVVDVTNYVLHAYGQPTHAFDLRTLEGPEIRVRRAAHGETLTTLDGVERSLSSEVLVIADARRAVALAGIMGGRATEVTDATTDILLEGAWFQPARVRDGSRFLGLATDASVRFGRGIDRTAVPEALRIAAHWIAEIAGGEHAQGAAIAGSADVPPRAIAFRFETAERLLGEALPEAEIVEIFDRLALRSKREGEHLRVELPSWRGDLDREEDLVEEIARYHGYNRFTERNWNAGGAVATRSRDERWHERSVGALLSLGFQEIQTNALLSEEDAERGRSALASGQEPARLLNAKSREASVLRPALWPQHLHVARRNARRGIERFRFFEHGKTFAASQGAFPERWELAGGVRGDFIPAGWAGSPVPTDLYTLKGVIEAWAQSLALERPAFSPLGRTMPPFDPSRSSAFENARGLRGKLGCIDPALARALDLPDDLWLFSIDFEDCLKLDAVTPCYHEPSRYPPVKRDLAFVVGKRVSHAEIEQRFWADGRGLVRSVHLFDVYEGAPVPEGQRSMAFSLLFQSHERSLLNEEVDALVGALAQRLRDDFGAVLRDA